MYCLYCFCNITEYNSINCNAIVFIIVLIIYALQTLTLGTHIPPATAHHRVFKLERPPYQIYDCNDSRNLLISLWRQSAISRQQQQQQRQQNNVPILPKNKQHSNYNLLLISGQIACLQFIINLISRTKEAQLGAQAADKKRVKSQRSAMTLTSSAYCFCHCCCSSCYCCCCCCICKRVGGASIGLMGPFGRTLFTTLLFSCCCCHIFCPHLCVCLLLLLLRRRLGLLQFKGTTANTVSLWPV